MLKKTFHQICLGGLVLGAHQICLGGGMLGGGSFPALAVNDLAILMPDAPSTGTDPVTLPLAQAWLDAINEEGFNVNVIRDSQFATVAATYKAIILPDSVHQQASATLVSAVNSYVNGGGKVMIVYDFGALNSNGLLPASGPNPFSSLVGVDYNLYGELYIQSSITPVGLGPIYGMESDLWKLQVPPGKYMPFTPTPKTAATKAATTSSVASATSTSAIPTAYLKTSNSNPGGTVGYNAGYVHQIQPGSTAGTLTTAQITAAQSKKIPANAVIGLTLNLTTQDPVSYVPGDTLQTVSGYFYGPLTYPTYVTCNLGHTPNIATSPANCTGTGTPYTGTPLLVSEKFGMVAGYSSNGQGKGSVLFVNLPLSYLKSQTDGMLMHGFIHYFGDTLLNRPRLSGVPNGIPGMTVNVHVDSQEAIDPINQMDTAGIWKEGPFSVHFTGGPVVDYVACQYDLSGAPVKSLPVNGKPATCANMVANPLGDVVYKKKNGNLIPDPNQELGLDIPNNTAAQAVIKKFNLLTGYQVGAHGGWLHNYYGNNAHDDIFDSTGKLVNPANAATYQPYLPQNKTAVENVVLHATTEYSAPQGNNPKWAVNWLETNGILGMYYLGSTGMGPTRHWREGNLLNQKAWMFPVMPFGLYATFEDFAANLVSPADVTAWLNKLVDFSVTQGTTRMMYFHPPGAIGYLSSLTSMLSRAKSYANSLSYNFRWYTMTDLSKFMTNRKQVTWKATPQTNGSLLFEASHPTDLTGQTWILPKAGFSQPAPTAQYTSNITIGQDSTHWLVIANNGKSLSFSANPL